jgi:hypothetical protein
MMVGRHRPADARHKPTHLIALTEREPRQDDQDGGETSARLMHRPYSLWPRAITGDDPPTRPKYVDFVNEVKNAQSVA